MNNHISLREFDNLNYKSFEVVVVDHSQQGDPVPFAMWVTESSIQAAVMKVQDYVGRGASVASVIYAGGLEQFEKVSGYPVSNPDEQTPIVVGKARICATNEFEG